jgi:hypothetical protein
MSQGSHANSIACYYSERGFGERAQKVLALFQEHPLSAYTDREVMVLLGFSDMNAVRPRLSELIDAGELLEIGKKPCAVTGKNVRLVKLAPKPWGDVP